MCFLFFNQKTAYEMATRLEFRRVILRSLALGNLEKGGFWRMIRRELSAGFILGLICMISITLIISVIYDGNWRSEERRVGKEGVVVMETWHENEKERRRECWNKRVRTEI